MWFVSFFVVGLVVVVVSGCVGGCGASWSQSILSLTYTLHFILYFFKMPAFKHISGNKAAVAMTMEAVKGTAIGLVLALGYKVAMMDPAQNFVSSYYHGRPSVKN